MTPTDIDRRLRDHLRDLPIECPPPADVVADVARRVRRRHRRRVGVSVVAMAAVASVVAAVIVTSDDGRQRVATAPTEGTAEPRPAAVHLVMVDAEEGPQLADPSTGNRSPLRSVGVRFERWCSTCPVVRVGDRAFTAQQGGLLSYAPGDGELRVLGPADLVFPTADGLALFVVRGRVIEERTVDNTRVDGPWTLPDGYDLTVHPHAVSGGFVVADKTGFIGELAWWDPATGEVHPLGDFNQFIDVFTDDEGEDLLAWTTCPTGDFPCSLVLSDLGGAARRVIDPPIAGNGFYLGGAFSPDGTTLATTVSLHPGVADPDAGLALIDVASGQATVVSDSRFLVGEPHGDVTWSPNGDTIFFSGDDGVRAFDPATGRITDLPFPGSYGPVAAVPAR